MSLGARSRLSAMISAYEFLEGSDVAAICPSCDNYYDPEDSCGHDKLDAPYCSQDCVDNVLDTMRHEDSERFPS